MTLTEQCNQQLLNHLVLPDDELGNFRRDALIRLGEPLRELRVLGSCPRG